MNGIIHVFPGTFSPPTVGHLEVVRKAAKLCENLTIICSKNPDKTAWFTPEECVELWKSYDLPANVNVTTFSEFAKAKHDMSKIVMVRGIRGEKDLAHESSVILLNKKDYGIDNYLFILTSSEFENVSSTKAREIAFFEGRTDNLLQMVTAEVATQLIAKALAIKKENS